MTDWNREWQETAPRLHAWLKRRAVDVAEDILQETFMRAMETERKSRKQIAQPAAYLFRTARNLLISSARTSARTESTSHLEFTAAADVSMKQMLPDLMAAINRLENQDQELIELHLSGLNQKDIGVVLGISDRQVRRRYESIRQELRDYLEASYG